MSTDTTETKVSPETPETPAVPAEIKVPVSVRRDLATAAFSETSVTATAAATLFANIPNGREHLDAVYNAAVAAVATNPEITADPAVLGAHLAPLATRRTEIATEMATISPAKASRVVDPAAERAALIVRLGTLSATWAHLATAVTWIEHLFDEIDPGDLSDDERLTFTSVDVPEKVSGLTTRLAAAITSTPRASTATGERAPRTESDRVKPMIGTRFSDAKGRFVTLTGETNERSIGPDAWTLDDGRTFNSISTAATDGVCNGTSTNGWKHFSIVTA